MQFLIRYPNTECFPVMTIIALGSLLVPTSTVIFLFFFLTSMFFRMTHKRMREDKLRRVSFQTKCMYKPIFFPH